MCTAPSVSNASCASRAFACAPAQSSAYSISYVDNLAIFDSGTSWSQIPAVVILCLEWSVHMLGVVILCTVVLSASNS